MSLIPPGWSAADLAGYQASIGQNVVWQLRGRILDLAGNHLSDLPMIGSSAQTNIDSTADVDRTLQVEINDPDGTGGLEQLLGPDVAPRHLIQLTHTTYVPKLAKTLSLHVFTGRPVAPNTDGITWSITALGKECLYLNHPPASTIKEGTYVVDAIRNGLIAGGEDPNRMVIPSSAEVTLKVSDHTPVGGSSDDDTRPWTVWTRLARDAGYQLFFDAGGIPIMRRIPTDALLAFTWDISTDLSQLVERDTDLTVLRNRYVAEGGHGLRADVTATGPYSPQTLATGPAQVPWYDIEYAEQNPALVTKAQMTKAATTGLNDLLAIATDIGFDGIPYFPANPLDQCGIQIPGYATSFPLTQASIPVSGDTTSAGQGWPMTVGYQAKVRRGAPAGVKVSRHKKKKRR